MGPGALADRVAEEHSLHAALHDHPPAYALGRHGKRFWHALSSGVLLGFRSVRAPRNAERPHERTVVIAWTGPRCRRRARRAPPAHALFVRDASRAGELERELVRARSDLEHEHELAQERLATLTDAQEQLSASFKALSADALKSSIDQLTELNRAQLNAARAEARGDLDNRRQAVEQLVGPLKEQLGRVDAQLVAFDQERRESRGRLEAQLRTLAETGEKLRSETGALVTALRKPNARGQWGQMQLRNVVELAGMVRYCDFAEQLPVAGDETTLRPDLVVNLPGGKHVVVDAKAPLQGVLDAYQARDEAERQKHLRDHARLLRRHVKALADKAYWAGLDSSPDLVVMFLPGEHLYGAALEADPALIEDAMARRVLIATPTTLLAMLTPWRTGGSRSGWPSPPRRSPSSAGSCTAGW